MPWISGNYWLNLAEMNNNADIIYPLFTSLGWSSQAICAILGNMRRESTINPGRWQVGFTPYDPTAGYGLTQWTPYTKYSNWATANGYVPWEDNGDAECYCINYEALNNIQWSYNYEIGMAPPITFTQFMTSTLPLNDLTNYFLWFYEHPADPYAAEQALRQSYAQYFWNRYNGGGATLPPWLLKKLSDSWRR